MKDTTGARIGALLVGVSALFVCFTCSQARAWYDERRDEYTPAAYYQREATPANMFEIGDHVQCVLLDENGAVIETINIELGSDRKAKFTKSGALAHCRQGKHGQ